MTPNCSSALQSQKQQSTFSTTNRDTIAQGIDLSAQKNASVSELGVAQRILV
jgi:hypothetical protein